MRMGVPIYTSHTILSANGKDEVESVTIAELDAQWKPVPGTEQTFDCDTVLVAVGLDPVDEFLHKAREFGLPVYAAGDAEEIAEASAAMFTGKIRGLEIARALGRDVGEVPPGVAPTAEVLKSRPGATVTEDYPRGEKRRLPAFSTASRRSPAIPCTSVCPRDPSTSRATTSSACPYSKSPTRQGLHGLREVRGHLPGAGHHAGRLPQGPRVPHRHHPLRIPQGHDRGRRPGHGPGHQRGGAGGGRGHGRPGDQGQRPDRPGQDARAQGRAAGSGGRRTPQGPQASA